MATENRYARVETTAGELQGYICGNDEDGWLALDANKKEIVFHTGGHPVYCVLPMTAQYLVRDHWLAIEYEKHKIGMTELREYDQRAILAGSGEATDAVLNPTGPRRVDLEPTPPPALTDLATRVQVKV